MYLEYQTLFCSKTLDPFGAYGFHLKKNLPYFCCAQLFILDTLEL